MVLRANTVISNAEDSSLRTSTILGDAGEGGF
jgi:hypothetical protein